MKSFSCRDVIPDCTAKFEGETEEEILRRVIDHARADHHMTEVSENLIELVKAKIKEFK